MRQVQIQSRSDLNAMLQIEADEKAEGGASHLYAIKYAGPATCAGQYGENIYPDVDVRIHFQKGAMKEVGFNGISDEALIAIVIDRLRGFQSGPFSCRENALALTKLEEAMMWLDHRTRDRMARGVEGVSVA